MRVNSIVICVTIQRDGDKKDVIFEEYTGKSNLDRILNGVREIVADYKVEPSFEYLCQITLESLSINPADGPDGIRHTMDQIQTWYHRRYVPPFAPLCGICGQPRAKHGPSVEHQFIPTKEDV